MKQYAEDCLKIYNILLEKEGAVWRSKWEVLTDWIGVKGEYPNSFLAYKPSELGYMFLKQNEK